MDTLLTFPLVIRWLHILCACLAVGAPFFVRYILTPAAEATLDVGTHQRLRAAIGQLWRLVVYAIITLFILTGLYTFIYVILPLPLGELKPMYHSLFGLKMILSVTIFFLASALAGRTQAMAFIRAKAKTYLALMFFLLLVTLMLANTLRALRDEALRRQGRMQATTGAPTNPASLPASTPTTERLGQ